MAHLSASSSHDPDNALEFVEDFGELGCEAGSSLLSRNVIDADETLRSSSSTTDTWRKSLGRVRSRRVVRYHTFLPDQCIWTATKYDGATSVMASRISTLAMTSCIAASRSSDSSTLFESSHTGSDSDMRGPVFERIESSEHRQYQTVQPAPPEIPTL